MIRMTHIQPGRTLPISSTNLTARDVEAIVLATTTGDPIMTTISASIVRAFDSVLEGCRAIWR
jgi:hypothetical protein